MNLALSSGVDWGIGVDENELEALTRVANAPRGTGEIILVPKASAEPDMDLLAAELEDVFGELSENMKKIFRGRDEER